MILPLLSQLSRLRIELALGRGGVGAERSDERAGCYDVCIIIHEMCVIISETCVIISCAATRLHSLASIFFSCRNRIAMLFEIFVHGSQAVGCG